MSDPRSPGGKMDGPSDTQAGGARLVLTPALRIPDEGQTDPADPREDEDLLRQMVREILEEELRGAFGTRITREVRKLVRTEVRTLLAARDTE